MQVSYTQSYQIFHTNLLQGGRRESEEAVNGLLRLCFLLLEHFLRPLACFGNISASALTFLSDIHWCAINWTQPWYSCGRGVHCRTDIYAWVLSYMPHHCQDMCRWCEICAALMTHGRAGLLKYMLIPLPAKLVLTRPDFCCGFETCVALMRRRRAPEYLLTAAKLS